MRVAVDARHLLAGRGVAHYTAGLVAALAAGFPEDDWTLFVPGRDPLTMPAPHGAALRRHRFGGRPLFGAAALIGRPRLERLAPADVVLLPSVAPVAVGVPYVLTVQDLSFIQRPRDFTPYERLWHALARPRRLARGAARVIVGTQATRALAVDLLGVEEERVRVVALGVQAPRPAPLEPVRARLGIPERYLLFAGALEPRKAPGVLLEAYARARDDGLEAALVLAGGGRLELPERPGVVRCGALPRAELDALIGGALAVVLPSWVEGFGLPPLEALAAGVPAVVSDLPVFAETLGDAALRFPAGDAAALAARLCEIAGDGALRAQLVARGRPRVARLTWERAAVATRAVLAEAAPAR